MSLWLHIDEICSVAGGAVHASDPFANGLKSKRKTWPTACGRQRARLYVLNIMGGGQMSIKWPPRVDEMRVTGLARCAECLRRHPGKPVPLPPLVDVGAAS